MNKKKSSTEADRLNSARLIIGNSMDTPYIAESLARFGYDRPKLEEGESLLTAAEALVSRHKKEYGDQYAATDTMHKSHGEAHALYMQHVKLARMALKNDPGLSESLQLQGERKKTIGEWINQAGIFYENALASAEIKAALSSFGIDETALERGKALVNEVVKAQAIQLKEMGEAQSATLAKDKAMKALDEWVSGLRAVARIAITDDPQLLEALGIMIPSN